MLVEQWDIHAVVYLSCDRDVVGVTKVNQLAAARAMESAAGRPSGQQRTNWCRISLAPIVVPVTGRWTVDKKRPSGR
jgi:hypothetical protein